ncbi:MAG: type II toxin-antitoxin system Phd/YefM family antitoxin [Gemmatimonadaceae bacterium]
MPPNPARRFISASEFKARCLELMDEVNATRAELVITKHGAAVARLVPMADGAASAFGFLRGTVRNELSLFDSEGAVGVTTSPRRSATVRAALPKSKSAKSPGTNRSK